MSDLISRSELIDLILTENQRCITSTGHELTTNMIVSFIERQQTAYDVDKVVEELEKVKTINVDVGFGTIYKTIRKDIAIEIVKYGDVSDDVCGKR